jgi:nitrite reductase/ring-hydroxylating ferredoxin subunit
MNPADPEGVTIPPDRRPLEEQPRWRQDFPIDWPRDEYVSRRDFTKFMVLTSLAFTVGQFWILLLNLFRQARDPLPAVPIVRVEEVPVGGSRLFHYPTENDPRILVRLGEEHFVAYDQLCTHLLCPVLPQVAAGVLYCPCHEGYFDILTGRAIAGPPRRPLPRVELEVRNGMIYATDMQEGIV